MTVNEGFDELQRVADAHIDVVREARRRRDVFRTALPTGEDVLEVVPTGSLARGHTQGPDPRCRRRGRVRGAEAHPTWETQATPLARRSNTHGIS
jgi:hypothetical protein